MFSSEIEIRPTGVSKKYNITIFGFSVTVANFELSMALQTNFTLGSKLLRPLHTKTAAYIVSGADKSFNPLHAG